MKATRSLMTGSSPGMLRVPLSEEGSNLAVDPSLVFVRQAPNRTAILDPLLVAGHDAQDRKKEACREIRRDVAARSKRIECILSQLEMESTDWSSSLADTRSRGR